MLPTRFSKPGYSPRSLASFARSSFWIAAPEELSTRPPGSVSRLFRMRATLSEELMSAATAGAVPVRRNRSLGSAFGAETLFRYARAEVQSSLPLGGGGKIEYSPDVVPMSSFLPSG